MVYSHEQYSLIQISEPSRSLANHLQSELSRLANLSPNFETHRDARRNDAPLAPESEVAPPPIIERNPDPTISSRGDKLLKGAIDT
jgi:hypothetical protein